MNPRIRPATARPVVVLMATPIAILTAVLATLLFPPAASAQPEYATRFSFTSCDHATILHVTDAWPGAGELVYALVPRGTRAPEGDFTAVLTVPVRRVVSLSTTFLPHIVSLDRTETLVAVDTGAYVYDETVRRGVARGDIAEVGASPAVDIETLIELQPDLVLLSAIAGDDPVLSALERAAIPALVVADWRELTPLGRAEWVRVFGLIFARSDAADALFARVAADYTALADRVDSAVGGAAVGGAAGGGKTGAPAGNRPRVLVNAPYQGTWALPAGNSYTASLLSDAGADYLWNDAPGIGTVFLDIEAVVSRALHADYWVNLGYGWRSRSDALESDPRFAALPVYRENRMYHYNSRVNEAGGNDFWESGAARPDLVLSDLVSIFHPSLLPGYEAVYYRRLDP